MKKLSLPFGFLLILFLQLCCCLSSFAQTAALSKKLLQYKQHSDSLAERNSGERIYIQSDKPYYAAGDTIWFKAYIFDAASKMLSARSGLLHVDFINEDKQIIKQYLLPISNGLSWGNIAFDERYFKPGNYIMRAYTNWMRNFGKQDFFYRNISITGNLRDSWMVNSQINTAVKSDGQHRVTGRLRLTTADRKPIGDSVLKLEVTSHNRSLYRQPAKTDVNGMISLDFNLPPKTDYCQIVIKGHSASIAVPFAVADVDQADVQFLPESGDMIAGSAARIGFKATGVDGKGIDISGVIEDHNGRQVASFASMHKGIGSFEILPQANEVYTAKVDLGGGHTKDYLLPAVKVSGTTLTVDNKMSDDSVNVIVSVTNDLLANYSNFFLVARSSSGINCFAAVVGFTKNNQLKLRLPKRAFPEGIAHFLLLNTGGQPLNERIAFIDHHDHLKIDINPDRPLYQPKDSVSLTIRVADNDGKPAQGSFSLAVTDDAQIRSDSLNQENILTRMLLTGDLKGYVEEPWYYFQDNNDSWQALDNLLLTQGWVRYEPSDIKITFPAETEYTVTGKVNNAFYKPVAGTDIKLLSKSPFIMMDTLTNADGRFVFHQFPRIDTPVFVLKAVNKRGKSGNTSITIDEPSVPEPSLDGIHVQAPWYLNADSTLINNLKNNMVNREQEYNPTGSHMLKEVTIKAKRTINGSQNINGSGNADVVLDEKFLAQQGKKDWLQLLESNVKSFNYTFRTVFPPGRPAFTFEWFFVDSKIAVFVIDGVRLTDALPSYSFAKIKQYLQSHNAEDIKGIEVMYSGEYSVRYASRYDLYPFFEYAFIEITTRSGRGPVIDNTAGMYLYKPMAVSWPKQFYKPKYNVSDTSKLADLRSTIDWEPNVVTDSMGRATVSFYTGSLPSTYTAILEGTDLKGNMVYKRAKITVGRPGNGLKSK